MHFTRRYYKVSKIVKMQMKTIKLLKKLLHNKDHRLQHLKGVLDYTQLQKPKSTYFSIFTALKPLAF